jgi:hypothetical protein
VKQLEWQKANPALRVQPLRLLCGLAAILVELADEIYSAVELWQFHDGEPRVQLRCGARRCVADGDETGFPAAPALRTRHSRLAHHRPPQSQSHSSEQPSVMRRTPSQHTDRPPA